MTLVDANLLLYAYDRDSPHHEPARSWLEAEFSSGRPVHLALVTLLAFVRIASDRRAFAQPLRPEEACEIVRSWLDLSAVRIPSPGPRSWQLLGQLCREGQAAGPLVMDAHLAALAVEHGLTIATTDRDFVRFPSVSLTNPLSSAEVRTAPVKPPVFRFRPLAEDDLPLLWDWLNRPHVAEWWLGEVSIDEVREKYLPRIAGADAARPFIALLDGEPAGYVQSYLCAAGPDWWPEDPGEGVLGIDQFLALGDRLDQGLGTAMVRQFTAWLMEDPAVTEIRVDPSPDNGRAIRCYEKADFRPVGEITTPDGPALMMVLGRGVVVPGLVEPIGIEPTTS